MDIIVLDDDKSFLRSLAIILRREGHRVACFADPCIALENLREGESPDVLFVDLSLPRMTGLEFLAAAGPCLPRQCKKAIVTGHAEHLGESELQRAGVDMLFPKPLDLAGLKEVLKRIGRTIEESHPPPV